jgi:hypothetical protein
MEPDIYAAYGRKQFALETALSQHQETLRLLAAIKAGANNIDDVTIIPGENGTIAGWNIKPALAAVPANTEEASS